MRMRTDALLDRPRTRWTGKVDAYDYTIYGDLPGRLVYISADTLREDLRQGEQPYYRILVRTEGRKSAAAPTPTSTSCPA